MANFKRLFKKIFFLSETRVEERMCEKEIKYIPTIGSLHKWLFARLDPGARMPSQSPPVTTGAQELEKSATFPCALSLSWVRNKTARNLRSNIGCLCSGPWLNVQCHNPNPKKSDIIQPIY